MKKENRKKLIASACAVAAVTAIAVPLILYFLGIIDYAKPVESSGGKYLFCYFVGNEPEEERIRFALSEDGYNFTPLNGNQPVITQTLGTKSVRDPYLFRDRDGCYRIVATDMKSADGWASNHCIITWKSTDLIHWTDEALIDMRDYGLENTVRAWAPQAIWDGEEGMYMLYWANCEHNEQTDEWTKTVIWYAYTRDFKALATQPQILFEPSTSKDAIDADILAKDGRYYMYFKDEDAGNICLATSESLTGPYRETDPKEVSAYFENTEGSQIYNITGTDTYVMMMDAYGKERFLMQQTTDLLHFKRLKNSDYSLNFGPRHGSVLAISDSEYDVLLNYFGN